MMKTWVKIGIALFIGGIHPLDATPTSVFWTVCTTDIAKTGEGHVDENTFFTLFNRRGHGSSLDPDTGFELGMFNWHDFNVEAGVDYLGGADDPWYFNIGVGIEEGKLFLHAPSFKVGMFNIGTQTRCRRTDENIVDLIAGKSLPDWIGGKVFAGVFSGSRAMGKDKQGFMVAYTRPFSPAVHCDNTNYFKWVLAADYASGKNTIGGGGVGLYHFFTPNISLLMGPVWFNDAHLNGRWKWSVQIDMSFSVFDP